VRGRALAPPPEEAPGFPPRSLLAVPILTRLLAHLCRSRHVTGGEWL
jgi:hypothetical protein